MLDCLVMEISAEFTGGPTTERHTGIGRGYMEMYGTTARRTILRML